MLSDAQKFASPPHRWMYVCMYVCMCVYIYICVCICICRCRCVFISTYIYVEIRTCIMCVYVYTQDIDWPDNFPNIQMYMQHDLVLVKVDQ